MLARYFAAQLRKPTGLFGRHVLLPFLNRRNSHFCSLVLEALRLSPMDHVLEVGFGGGELMAHLISIVERGHVSGIDFSEDAVAMCTDRFERLIKTGKIDLHCGSVESLPFDPETFTKACSVNVIYFWPAPLIALKQLRSVLKGGGTLVICFTPREFLEGREVMRHGFTLYDPEEVGALLAEADFRDVRVIKGVHARGECVAVVGEK